MSGDMCHSLFWKVRLEYLFDTVCWFSIMNFAQVPFSIVWKKPLVMSNVSEMTGSYRVPTVLMGGGEKFLEISGPKLNQRII